jgi:epoxyqueuosine reductase
MNSPREIIRAKALEVGFDAVGFAPAELGADVADNLRKFLARGYYGEMAWMPEKADRRIGPTALWPEAKSVIALGMNYAPAEDPLALADRPDRGVISVYARNRDYHDIVKKRLKVLGRWIVESQGCEIKVFVDTAPVMEKPLAARAGIGWQGKHTNLVSREHGSWLFLGEIYTTLEIDPDAVEEDHCGSCRDCLDACPTNAFPAPRQIDARRCISYLTIEHKGPIREELRPLMGNRIYGCDDCLAVCPWNKFAKAAREPAFLPRAELTAPRLADLVQLDDAGFRQLFAGSPIKRIGSARFIRNVLIALGNSGDAAQVPVVEALCGDDDPVVRDAAAWAVARLKAAPS